MHTPDIHHYIPTKDKIRKSFHPIFTVAVLTLVLSQALSNEQVSAQPILEPCKDTAWTGVYFFNKPNLGEEPDTMCLMTEMRGPVFSFDEYDGFGPVAESISLVPDKRWKVHLYEENQNLPCATITENDRNLSDDCPAGAYHAWIIDINPPVPPTMRIGNTPKPDKLEPQAYFPSIIKNESCQQTPLGPDC